MRYREGARVVTSENEDVGTVDRVVVHPRTREVTHLVVRKGFLFTDDKVLPVEYVASAEEEQIQLKADAGNLDDLPNYEETNYVMVDNDELVGNPVPPGYASPYYYYPVVGVRPFIGPGYWGPYPTTFQTGPYITETETNIPDETIAIKTGAKVVSRDGDDVGEVAEVIADRVDNKVTHLVISKGLLSKEEKLIPAGWVDSVGEDRIRLFVGSHFIEDLPAYERK